MTRILGVDLITFEKGDQAGREGVVDGVMRSLCTGFVYISHDLSESLMDEAYGMLVETAAASDPPDWKERLIAALPRATARGLQLETGDGWIDAAPPAERANLVEDTRRVDLHQPCPEDRERRC
ncbi:MAG: hypothetical protein GY698_23730 [Actinomycetia bacterium]|nr:hypothetical protein [Actinomycetes bacterium]